MLPPCRIFESALGAHCPKRTTSRERNERDSMRKMSTCVSAAMKFPHNMYYVQRLISINSCTYSASLGSLMKRVRLDEATWDSFMC